MYVNVKSFDDRRNSSYKKSPRINRAHNRNQLLKSTCNIIEIFVHN